MATHWVPDLLNIKGISGHPWRSVFIFANGALYIWSNKRINVSLSLWPCVTYFEVKITYILKSSEWGLEKRVAMATKCFIAVGVFSVELLACQVFLWSALQIGQDSSIYTHHVILVECMTWSVISFAYFTHFSNLNISGTNAGICKR